MNGLLPTASRACGMPREVIAKDASRLIGGACGLPESGKRPTGPSRFYRVTATPGPLVVKWRGSVEGPADLRPWTGSAPPDNSSRSPRAARKPVHFLHRAGKGTRLAAPRLEGTRVPRQFDATTHLGRHDQPSWADMANHLGRQGRQIMNERETDDRQARMTASARIPQEQSVRDVMTRDPKALDATASVMDAAELMRESDIGDVVVLEDDHLCGIVTDRDIVVRVLAEGCDAASVTLGEICSRELTTISPTASVGDAVRLIREKAIRRLPVVEED